MEIKNSAVTFWFNKQSNPKMYVEDLNDALKEYFFEFNTIAVPANIDPGIPRLNAVSSSNHSNLEMSLINMRLNTNFDDNFSKDADKCLSYLKERANILFDVLTKKCEIPILFFAILINIEEKQENSSNILTTHFLKDVEKFDNMSEVGIRLSKEMDGKFYKNIVLSNVRQIKIDKIITANETEIILPLIPLNEASEIEEYLLTSLEVNDKYGFNSNKNYNTNKSDFDRMFEITLSAVKDEMTRFN